MDEPVMLTCRDICTQYGLSSASADGRGLPDGGVKVERDGRMLTAWPASVVSDWWADWHRRVAAAPAIEARKEQEQRAAEAEWLRLQRISREREAAKLITDAVVSTVKRLCRPAPAKKPPAKKPHEDPAKPMKQASSLFTGVKDVRISSDAPPDWWEALFGYDYDEAI